MSKLSNKIRKTTRVEPAPLGFGLAAARPRPPSLLLMVHGPASGMRAPTDLTDSGLDALLLSLNPERETAEAARWAKVAGELPCGLRIPSATHETVAALKRRASTSWPSRPTRPTPTPSWTRRWATSFP